MRTFWQSSGRRWYGQNVVCRSRSLLELGVLIFESPFDQIFNLLLGIFRSILVEFAPSLLVDFDVQVFIGWPCNP